MKTFFGKNSGVIYESDRLVTRVCYGAGTAASYISCGKRVAKTCVISKEARSAYAKKGTTGAILVIRAEQSQLSMREALTLLNLARRTNDDLSLDNQLTTAETRNSKHKLGTKS